MNDRFITLALDAGLLNYVDHETPRHYFINGHAEQEDVEKFAELIVRECARCVTQPTIQAAGQMELYIRALQDVLANDMKAYFGVEE
jgi:hypothetical protein